ncbi:MAG: type II secretion system F family protein [Chloroflexota bacterium]
MVPVLILMVAAGGVGGLFLMRSRSARAIPALEARLGRFGITPQAPVVVEGGDRRAVSRNVEHLLGHTRLAQKIGTKLERADIKATPSEFIAIWAAIVGGGIVVGLIVHGIIGSAGLGLAGVVLPYLYLGRRQKKRAKAFENQLADMAQMMGNSMRAGFSILQSMALVSEEGPSPAKDEFQRVVTEVELGLPLDVALDHLMERMPSEDLGLMIVAINVQRQVGGNLAEILAVISETVRARVRFQRDLRSMTAQARYSSYIITALPIGVGVAINLLDQPYESYLYTHTGGNIMLGIAIAMISLGFFFLSRLAKIEV